MTSPDQNYTSWHVGMQVTLRFKTPTHPNWNYPEFGVVYTVRAIFEMQGAICIRLKEIRNKVSRWRDGRYEPGFEAYAFRPVQTRKTDISIFTAMLSPKPAKAGKVRA